MLGRHAAGSFTQPSKRVQTVTAYIDENVTDEQMEDILNYIDFIKQRHAPKGLMYMDKVEELMAAYPDLHFLIFDKNMPEGQQGLYIDDHIYLNPKQSKADLLGTLGEEIGHYLTNCRETSLHKIPMKA